MKCAQCGWKLTEDSASPDFCDPICQERWYAKENAKDSVAVKIIDTVARAGKKLFREL